MPKMPKVPKMPKIMDIDHFIKYPTFRIKHLLMKQNEKNILVQ
jgi:hypothetical protein